MPEMESAESMPTTANRTGWRSEKAHYRADVFLSQDWLHESDGLEKDCAGFRIERTMLDAGLPVPLELISASHAVVVEVRCDQPSAMDRFQRLLAEAAGTPIIAAVPNPSVADMRRLMRTGVADILPLPLRAGDLGPALERIGADLERRRTQGGPVGKTVCAIKACGGVGATSILTQIACLTAAKGAAGSACLIDLDLQFGNAAFYLGSLPALNVKDLIGAGSRLDQSLLRSTLSKHSSGLSYVGAPHDIVPLDFVTAEQATAIVDLAAREYSTLFIDLPHDWTNWSLSILAQADTILLVCDLSLSSLRQAKRQLDFLRQNDLGTAPVHVVANRVSKGLFKSVRFDDAQKILGRPVAFSIADDPDTVRSALDQGRLVSDTDPRARVSRDLAAIAGIVATPVEAVN